jgi:hypothetical protein
MNAPVYRWTWIQVEIQHRWPSLQMTSLESELRTANMLATVLSEELGFSARRAVSEAEIFWSDLEEKLRRAD